MTMTLEEVHTGAKTFAEKALCKAGIGKMPPLFVGFGRDDTPLIASGLMSSDPAERDALAAAVRHVFLNAGVTRCAFMCECWVSETATRIATDSGGKDMRAPSTFDDRTDGLMVISQDDSGRAICTQYAVAVLAGHIKLLPTGPEMDTAKDKDSQIQGRFLGLLLPIINPATLN